MSISSTHWQRWVRHIQDVRDRHHVLEAIPPERCANALCELNVAEQVISMVMVHASSCGQSVSIHS